MGPSDELDGEQRGVKNDLEISDFDIGQRELLSVKAGCETKQVIGSK